MCDGEKPILFVYRNSEDGMWEFFGDAKPNLDSAVVVGLSEIVSTDLSLLSLAELPLGWMASRDTAKAIWKTAPIVE